MDIESGNKIIAEFHGWAHYPTPQGKGMGLWDFPEWGKAAYYAKDFKYHRSFDWIMPACMKFSSLRIDGIEIAKTHDWECFNRDIIYSLGSFDLIKIFTALTEAIQWYNTNQSNLK